MNADEVYLCLCGNNAKFPRGSAELGLARRKYRFPLLCNPHVYRGAAYELPEQIRYSNNNNNNNDCRCGNIWSLSWH
jgi:hypothetical protein